MAKGPALQAIALIRALRWVGLKPPKSPPSGPKLSLELKLPIARISILMLATAQPLLRPLDHPSDSVFSRVLEPG